MFGIIRQASLAAMAFVVHAIARTNCFPVKTTCSRKPVEER